MPTKELLSELRETERNSEYLVENQAKEWQRRMRAGPYESWPCSYRGGGVRGDGASCAERWPDVKGFVAFRWKEKGVTGGEKRQVI